MSCLGTRYKIWLPAVQKSNISINQFYPRHTRLESSPSTWDVLAISKMQYQVIALAFAALAAAAPGSAPSYTSHNGDKPLSGPKSGSASVCTSGWTPQCCATNILGVAGLDCSAGMSSG